MTEHAKQNDPQPAAPAYQREMLVFDDLLDQIRHGLRNYMPAEGCPANWGHVKELSRVNELLTQVRDQLEGRN